MSTVKGYYYKSTEKGREKYIFFFPTYMSIWFYGSLEEPIEPDVESDPNHLEVSACFLGLYKGELAQDVRRGHISKVRVDSVVLDDLEIAIKDPDRDYDVPSILGALSGGIQ
ncbi:MAG: hypothetical protein AABW46_02445 [Nanoarchaeota archaeon]